LEIVKFFVRTIEEKENMESLRHFRIGIGAYGSDADSTGLEA
jgi:hypothetical protein